jgi:AraC-like DNA-binding protein
MGLLTHQDRLRKILEMVESGSLSSIRDLATEFKLSASHIQHLFKAHTGVGLGRQMAEQRLNRASLLLLQSDMSIKEIAYAVGYKHPSSFVRAFARRFGQAPSDYRQQMLRER